MPFDDDTVRRHRRPRPGRCDMFGQIKLPVLISISMTLVNKTSV